MINSYKPELTLPITHKDLEIFYDEISKEGLAICKSFRGCIALKYEVETLFKQKTNYQTLINEFNVDLKNSASHYTSKGIPQFFMELFNLTSKKEVEKFLNGKEVTSNELFLLLYNSDQIGFNVRTKFKKFVPDHLKHDDSDFKFKIENGKRSINTKSIRKVSGRFLERRNVSCLLLENGMMWHCFYFSYEDSQDLPKKKQHWKYGTHIHYVSYKWHPNREEIWKELDNRKVRISNMHIKFNNDNNPLVQVFLYGVAVLQFSKHKK